jgi:hypothetical protein
LSPVQALDLADQAIGHDPNYGPALRHRIGEGRDRGGIRRFGDS